MTSNEELLVPVLQMELAASFARFCKMPTHLPPSPRRFAAEFAKRVEGVVNGLEKVFVPGEHRPRKWGSHGLGI